MKLENEFTVNAPVDQAWRVMLDLDRVAPCVPGATLEGVTGDDYTGVMTVKLGPITSKYKGTVRLQEADEAARRAVLRAQGRDARGQDTISATVVSTMHEAGGVTRVHVETDMQITGRVAQFGRGIMQDVAAKLMNQFATSLEQEILTGDIPGAASVETTWPVAVPAPTSSTTAPAPAPTAPGAASDHVVSATASAGSASADTGAAAEAVSFGATTGPARRVPRFRENTPLDLGAASRNAVLKRLAPFAALTVAGILVILLVLMLMRRRRA